MECNKEIHDALIKAETYCCPFCDKVIRKNNKPIEEKCCVNQSIRLDNGFFVCINCGQVHSQYFKDPTKFIDFYKNWFKFSRKSVYNRKYCVKNIIYDICDKTCIQINKNHIDKIIKVFDLIEQVQSQINSSRKRMISLKFIIGKLIHMMNLTSNEIKTLKSKKTIKQCEQYWAQILNLIGDEIVSILNQQISNHNSIIIYLHQGLDQ